VSFQPSPARARNARAEPRHTDAEHAGVRPRHTAPSERAGLRALRARI